MTKEDIIWFAGLFDGEGCISIERHRPRAKSGERSMKYRLKVRANLELGSYGIGSYKDYKWVYGTGLAEPRLSQAKNL